MNQGTQITMFAQGGKVEALYDLSDFKAVDAMATLDLNVLPNDVRSFIEKNIIATNMANATFKNKTVLLAYYNLINKFSDIKQSADKVDFVATYEYLKAKSNDVSTNEKSGVEEKNYIDFLNKEKNLQRDRMYFDDYTLAVEWGKKNLDNFNVDMIKSETVSSVPKNSSYKSAADIVGDYILHFYKKQEQPKKQKLKTIKSISEFPSELKRVMPLFQQQIVAEMKSEELTSVMEDLLEQVKAVPPIGATENDTEKVVQLHYFYGDSDWYIFEMDDEVFFGYAILNGDLENAEYGYISIDELKNTNKVELDFHWIPRTLEESLNIR